MNNKYGSKHTHMHKRYVYWEDITGCKVLPIRIFHTSIQLKLLYSFPINILPRLIVLGNHFPCFFFTYKIKYYGNFSNT